MITMMKGMFVLLSLLCCVYADGKPFTVEEMHTLTKVSEMDVNHKGDVVYTASVWDPVNDVKTGYLKLKLNGGETLYLTNYTGVSDFNPKFINNGNEVAFLSTRGGTSVQLYSVKLNEKESSVQQLTNLPVDINGFKYSAFGNFFILQIDVFVDCDTLQCTADRDAQMNGVDWMHYDKLMVRNWDHWTTGKVSHLFKLEHGSNNPRDLMKNLVLNSPVPPFGGSEMYDISPFGDEIAFTAEDVSTSAAAWTTGWDIYIVSASGSANPVCITKFTDARTQNPAYSPDGATVAYLAMDRPGYEADRLHFNLYNRRTQKTTPLTAHLDISFSGYSWDAQSEYLIADADSDGDHIVYAINTKSGKQWEIIGNLQNAGTLLVPGTNSTFFIMRNSMKTPNEIWTFSTQTNILKGLKQVTFENEETLSAFDLITPEKIHFPGSLNNNIQGYFMNPVGFKENTMYPLVVLIHGGPQGAWNNDWSYRWNPQLWTSRGYAVAIFNFHGSTGFGQNFTDAINGHWGSFPYWDIINGTDYVLKQHNWLNKNAVSACGASYGGYMINWILGQTNMFSSLVVHDGMFDTISAYYTTEELWFPEWEFKGKPWTSRDIYERWNPSNFVTNWETPTLVIHGGKDYRLDITQGLSTFTTLQRMGIPSKLLVFPEENHWVLKPQNGIKWYNTVLEWLDQWNKN